MTRFYTFIGPDVFMDKKGMLHKKTKDNYTPLKNRYTEAEDRYVKKQLQKKGWDSK